MVSASPPLRAGPVGCWKDELYDEADEEMDDYDFLGCWCCGLCCGWRCAFGGSAGGGAEDFYESSEGKPDAAFDAACFGGFEEAAGDDAAVPRLGGDSVWRFRAAGVRGLSGALR